MEMGVAIVGSVLSVLGYMVYPATSMLWKVTLQPGVLRDLAFVNDEVKIMRDLLAAATEETGHRNTLLRVWIQQVRAVCYDLEDYLEILVVRRVTKSRWRRTIALLLDQRHIAGQVEALRMKVEALRQNLPRVNASGSNSKPATSPNAAALSYVAYNEYVLLHGDYKVTHAYDGTPLKQYKQINQILLEYNKDSMEDGVPVLPGETGALDYQIASELGKKIIRTILKSLRANELSSLCFTQFAESNILVSSSGKVKFTNVSILGNLPADVLLAGQRSNYMSAYEIIEKLFSGNPPQGIRHLLDLIKDDFRARELFHVHGSLVPIATHSTLFQYMYEHIRALPIEDARAILETLLYVDTWKTDIETNKLLLKPFNFNPKSYKVPADRPNQTCLNKDQMVALQGLGLTPEPHQRSLTPAQVKLIEALQFFEYLRNRAAHRMDAWRKWIESNRVANAQGSEDVMANLAVNAQGSDLVTADLAYNAQGSDLVTYIRFPLIVPHMQVELYKRNGYCKIHMDGLF